MIVDDHDPIRKATKRVLTALGFTEVIECFDGDDALKTLDKRPIDFLILDLMMRNVSGFDVLEHVRNRDIACDLPVLVVTGEADKEEIVKVADLGADDYLLKPFQANDLEKKVIKTLNTYFSPTPLLKALRQAERLYTEADYPRALAAFDAALKLDPKGARAAHGKALTLDRLCRTEEALDLLEQTIQTNFSYYRNHAAKANLLLRQGRTAEAVASMRRELEINPKQPGRQVQLARLLLKEGDGLGAVEHFRVALKDDPKRLDALMGMGHAYAAADNLDKSLYYFKRVRRHHPNATKALEAAVRCALAANEPKKAELLLRDEKASAPDRLDTYVILAMLYLRQDREDDALQVVEELLVKDPNHVQGLRIKGSLLLKKKQYPEALATLRQVARVTPSPEVLTSIGETLVGLGQTAEGMDALHKALAMSPDNPNALLLLADAYQTSKQWLKASLLYRRAAQAGAAKERCMSEAQTCAKQAALRRTRPRAAS